MDARNTRQWASALAIAAALTVATGAATAAAEPTTPPTPSSTPGSPTDAPGGGLEQRIDDDQEIASGEAVLEDGHVDLGPRYVDGTWALMVHDDTRTGSVWRPLDRTVLRVRDAATQRVPDDPAYDFLGVAPGSPVHIVPQTQQADVVWLGWNTQDPEVMRTVDRGLTLSLVSAEGPGDLLVYLQDGGFGEPDVLWDSRGSGPQPLWVDVNTHTHANWVFTEPGVYLVTIEATATLVDGAEERTTGTLRVAVGDDADAQQALSADAPEQQEVSSAEAEETTEATPDPGSDDGMSPFVLIGIAAAVIAVVLVWVLARGRRTRARALGAEER